MSATRWILHVDMDAFFAAIEQRDHPEYRGKPVMIGSPPDRRGIIATCSYEARKFGVHSAMPSRTAGKLCPQGIFLPPDMTKYSAESRMIMAILRDFTPTVEPVSIDEAFMDVTGSQGLFGAAASMARQIKDRILRERNLTASVGVASNKFLAKVASDLEKPDGLTVITEENKVAILAPLPVGRLWGVGKVTCEVLEKHGYRTIADIQKADPKDLEPLVGNRAAHLHDLAWGRDERPLEMDVAAKSIGSEHTFDTDTDDEALLRRTLLAQAETVARQLREEKVAARTITLKLRYANFTTLTRQVSLDQPTQDEMAIHEHVVRLLGNEKTGRRKIRLIGLTAGNLASPQIQLDLFDRSAEKMRKLALAVDELRARLGPEAIRRLGN
jgi:DNA polymerase-4